MISKFKTLVFIFWILLNPVIAFGQVPEYYSEIDFTKSSDEIKEQLHELISDNITFPYTSASTDVWDIIAYSNKHPNNDESLRLIYSGNLKDINCRDGGSSQYMLEYYKSLEDCSRATSWNREHVYPISNFKYAVDSDDDVYRDTHNIYPIIMRINAQRSNRKFGVKDKTISKGYGITQSNAFYPGDDFIGDVARTIMYMYIRYPDLIVPNLIGEGVIKNDIPEIFLLWNQMDPPDEYETNRNEAIYTFQANRNPFIDNPSLATKIWGGPIITDAWGAINSFEIDIFPNSSSTSIEVIKDTFNDEIIKYQIFDMSGKEVSNGETVQNIDISYLDNGDYVLKLFTEDYMISKKIKKI